MSDIAFISLPFQPIGLIKTPFYFSTAIMGEYLANLLGGTYYLGINSLHSFKSYSEKQYHEFEKKFNFIENKILYYDKVHINNISEVVNQLYQTHNISIFNEPTAICECGRVEMTKTEIERFYGINISMDLVEEGNGGFICKQCHKKLIFHNIDSLFLNFREKELNDTMNIFPFYLNSDFNHFRKTLLNSHLRISRERNTGVPVIIENRSFYLDIDMLWRFIPLLLKNKKIVIISSVKHLFSLFIIGYLSKIMNKKQIFFIGIPFIQTNELDQSVMRFFDNERHRQALKLLIILGIGWSKKNIILQEPICKFFMSSKVKNEELAKYIYSQIFEEDDWQEICKKISLYTRLQTVKQIKRRNEQ